MNPAQALDLYRSILEELQRLRAVTGDRALDNVDRQLYAEALRCCRHAADVEAVRIEIRRTCRFCPPASEVAEMASRISGVPLSQTGDERRVRRVVVAPPDYDRTAVAPALESVSAEAEEALRRVLGEEPAGKWLTWSEVVRRACTLPPAPPAGPLPPAPPSPPAGPLPAAPSPINGGRGVAEEELRAAARRMLAEGRIEIDACDGRRLVRMRVVEGGLDVLRDVTREFAHARPDDYGALENALRRIECHVGRRIARTNRGLKEWLQAHDAGLFAPAGSCKEETCNATR